MLVVVNQLHSAQKKDPIVKLVSNNLKDGEAIPASYAFGRPDPATHIALSDNCSPHLCWSDAPTGTRSFALLCIDPDVPSVGDNVNKEGRTVAADLPRTDFVHWVLIDLPPTCSELSERECGEGIVPHGKPQPHGPAGSRQGVNDYTSWFAGDPDMAGTYKGYDGPCPPWNDERLHHYIFTIYGSPALLSEWILAKTMEINSKIKQMVLSKIG